MTNPEEVCGATPTKLPSPLDYCSECPATQWNLPSHALIAVTTVVVSVAVSVLAIATVGVSVLAIGTVVVSVLAVGTVAVSVLAVGTVVATVSVAVASIPVAVAVPVFTVATTPVLSYASVMQDEVVKLYSQ